MILISTLRDIEAVGPWALLTTAAYFALLAVPLIVAVATRDAGRRSAALEALRLLLRSKKGRGNPKK